MKLDGAFHRLDRYAAVLAAQIEVRAPRHEELVADRPPLPAARLRARAPDRPRRLHRHFADHLAGGGRGARLSLYSGTHENLAAVPRLDADAAVRLGVHGDALPVGGQRDLADLAVALAVAMAVVLAPAVVGQRPYLLGRDFPAHGGRTCRQGKGQQGDPGLHRDDPPLQVPRSLISRSREWLRSPEAGLPSPAVSA